MAGHGGGAWKVAYADFVTAMMAFFMVMWILGQSKDVKQAVQQYFKDPYGVKSKTPGATVAGFKQGRGDAIAATQPGGPRPRGKGAAEGDKKNKPGKVSAVRDPSLFVLHDGDRRTVGTMVEFPENAAELDAETNEELKKFVPAWRGKMNKIEIRGHTTRRPLPPDSPYKTPWELCYARCLTAMKCLVDNGIEPERIRLSQAAAYEPHTISDEPNKQNKNARVEIHMLNEFVEDLTGTKEERAKRFQDDGKKP